MSKPQYMGGIGTTNVVPISPLYDFIKMKEEFIASKDEPAKTNEENKAE